ncbi:unnamed protein product [Pylaiella littoralis]
MQDAGAAAGSCQKGCVGDNSSGSPAVDDELAARAEINEVHRATATAGGKRKLLHDIGVDCMESSGSGAGDEGDVGDGDSGVPTCTTTTTTTAIATTGKSQCFDAFVVALRLARKTGDNRWYASTLELQLASVEFCRACRNVPVLNVRVEGKTPRYLWDPSKSKSKPTAEKSKDPTSSRVPLVRAIGLTWTLPTNALFKSFQEESQLVCVEKIKFDDEFDQPIAGVVWPASLRQISFGQQFNQSICGVVWPTSLQQLSSDVILTSPSREWRGQPRYNNYHSGFTSTSPSPEWCGRTPCKRLRSGICSTSPSPE